MVGNESQSWEPSRSRRAPPPPSSTTARSIAPSTSTSTVPPTAATPSLSPSATTATTHPPPGPPRARPSSTPRLGPSWPAGAGIRAAPSAQPHGQMGPPRGQRVGRQREAHRQIHAGSLRESRCWSSLGRRPAARMQLGRALGLEADQGLPDVRWHHRGARPAITGCAGAPRSPSVTFRFAAPEARPSQLLPLGRPDLQSRPRSARRSEPAQHIRVLHHFRPV